MNSMSSDEAAKIAAVSSLIKKVAAGLIVAILLFGSLGTVGAGERGVLLQFGAVQEKVIGEGLYFKIPFIQKVEKMDVRIRKDETKASAASKDLQTVTSVIALNFHVAPEQVANIWRDVGRDYKSRIIDPSIQEAVKASTAKFTAEELITKRPEVREDIKLILTEKLQSHGFMVDEFNIISFDFSRVFNDAIEAKVTAEQSALAAKNKLEQVKFEAQQAIEAAAGKAKAIQIEGDALKTSPQVTELRWIEKWDGKTPQVVGSGTPLLNIGLGK